MNSAVFLCLSCKKPIDFRLSPPMEAMAAESEAREQAQTGLFGARSSSDWIENFLRFGSGLQGFRCHHRSWWSTMALQKNHQIWIRVYGLDFCHQAALKKGMPLSCRAWDFLESKLGHVFFLCSPLWYLVGWYPVSVEIYNKSLQMNHSFHMFSAGFIPVDGRVPSHVGIDKTGRKYFGIFAIPL